MKRSVVLSGLLALSLVAVGCSQSMAQMTAPPGGGYVKVSDALKQPGMEFIPGIGTLYVVPATLPVGPFLAYDRQGKLVSTVYMVPVKDIEAHKAFQNLGVAHEKVDHVDMYYNAGHPGVPVPHYHVVVWYVGKEQAAALK
jgi:hypothetical protein